MKPKRGDLDDSRRNLDDDEGIVAPLERRAVASCSSGLFWRIDAKNPAKRDSCGLGSVEEETSSIGTGPEVDEESTAGVSASEPLRSPKMERRGNWFANVTGMVVAEARSAPGGRVGPSCDEKLRST